MDVQACLPPELRGAAITRMSAGLSGAGVYRVEHADGTYVLKVAAASDPRWRERVELLQRASRAGVAPRVVHVDEARRAVTSEHVVDRSLFPRLADPRTREDALALLGRTLRRVHDLAPVPSYGGDARDALARAWRELAVPVPAFVADAVAGVLAAVPAPSDRGLVTSHNDVNPSNFVYDGERVLLLDWDAAGANDPLYDLAALATFLDLDDHACARLVAAHDDAPPAALPSRFSYLRRLVAAFCGVTFLGLARAAGHAGSTSETLDGTPALRELYARMRSGAVDLATADGRWAFGLALIKTSA